MDNQNLENEKTFNILEYVKENLLGLILLLVVFFIIYFVDYINQLNVLIYSTPSPIPLPVASPQKISKRKFKKR
jgi:hypothetical protein